MWPNTVDDTRHRERPACRAAATAATVASVHTTCEQGHELSSCMSCCRKVVCSARLSLFRVYLMHSSLDVAASEPFQLLASLQEQAAICTCSGLSLYTGECHGLS